MKIAFYIREDIYEDGSIDMEACLVIDNGIIISDWSSKQSGLSLQVDIGKYVDNILLNKREDTNMTFIGWL